MTLYQHHLRTRGSQVRRYYFSNPARGELDISVTFLVRYLCMRPYVRLSVCLDLACHNRLTYCNIIWDK